MKTEGPAFPPAFRDSGGRGKGQCCTQKQLLSSCLSSQLQRERRGGPHVLVVLSYRRENPLRQISESNGVTDCSTLQGVLTVAETRDKGTERNPDNYFKGYTAD